MLNSLTEEIRYILEQYLETFDDCIITSILDAQERGEAFVFDLHTILTKFGRNIQTRFAN